MYLIGITARTYDPQGVLLVPHKSGSILGDISRRISRVKTLDGGVSVTNRGHSTGDRTVTISMVGMTREVVEKARRMVRLHAQVTVSMSDGCFVGVPSEYSESRNELIILIIKEA